MQVMVLHERGRPHLYITRRNLAQFRKLFESKEVPPRRNMNMFILKTFTVCWYAFIISGVLALVLFAVYAFQLRAEHGIKWVK
jgi:hypothetical protein